VASRLLRLTSEQAMNAVGLGYQQIAGASQRHLGMHAGWSSQGAVLAAMLAKEGVPGPKDILNGKNGMFRVYLQNERPDPVRLTRELGTRYRTLELHGFKAWPACGATRRPITGIIDLREEHKLVPEDVEAIFVKGGEHLLRLSEPLDFKRRPPHSAQAKFSLPFTCGVAMAYGDVRLHHYVSEGLEDQKVLAMADRVWVSKDASPTRAADAATVEIRMRDGRAFSREVVHPLGDDRHRPMSQQRLEAKFRDCASYAARAIPPANVERAIELVRELETLGDVRELLALL
jgi:2-methylcitrate dehydratase PrpD